jgi:acetyl-CoA synthetase (ADP-forming)
MKACCADIAHKTEKNLVRVDIRTHKEAAVAFKEISAGIDHTEQGCQVLIQEMVSGKRELVMGMTRDAQFGPCVMFGLGGIFTEVLKDIAFAKAPIDSAEAMALMKAIRGYRIIDEVRGMPAADRQMLAKMLINIGQIGLDMENVAEIDINPVILEGSRPVAVDALIVLD